jgi:hypothetical protein
MLREMKKVLLITGLILAGSANAQNYTRDAGMRLGDFFTLTYRQYMDEDQALEGMMSFGHGGMTFTVLKEFFEPRLSHLSENLFFQYGFGAHVGFRNMDHYRVLNRTYELDDWTLTPLLGIDGIVGLEYRFPDLPVLIGLDFKPYFEYSITQIFGIYLTSFGISMKYRF